MSTLHVYNTKQQALNARKIAELFSFTSNDFGGMVSSVENPVVFSTENSYNWSWNTNLGTQLHFIGGGVDISCDIDLAESWTFIQDTSENKKYYMWGLDVTIPSDKSSIITDVYDSNSAKIAQIACQEITFDYLYAAIEYPSGNPHEKEYYEYSDLELNYVISEDTEVDVF